MNIEHNSEINPQNYIEKVTFSNYKPDPDNQDQVVIVPSSLEEMELFGSISTSTEELNEFLGGGLGNV